MALRKNILWTENWNPAKIAKLDTPCWDCTSHCLSNGYPNIKRRGVSCSISRYIYQECFGHLPTKILVRHKCDNPKCINPEHLEAGSAQDNMNDKVNRGRQPSKMIEEDVRAILLSSGYSDYDLAKMFNVNATTINAIRKGRTWKHVNITDDNRRVGEKLYLIIKDRNDALKSQNEGLQQKCNFYKSVIERFEKENKELYLENRELKHQIPKSISSELKPARVQSHY